MRKYFVLLVSSLFFLEKGNSQTTIVSEDFEHSLTLFSATGIDTFFSGLSGVNDRPASSPFAVSNTWAYGNPGVTNILTSNTINTSAYSSVQLTLRLASFATNLSGGNDINDTVRIEISPDGGVNYYPTVQVTGNLNAYWSYAGGTGNASAAYDGDGTVVTFTPAGGGNRTTDGYSTITIPSLPQSGSLRVRIRMTNDPSSGELWVIDDFKITGNAVVGPLITIFPLSLSSFTAIIGGNISAEQTYTVSGSSLVSDININAPASYQISTTSGSGFGSSVTLTQTGGIVPNTTIYARLNTSITGSHSGNIANSSTGASTKNVVVSGNILFPEPTVACTVSFANLTTTSMDINFTGGNGNARIVVVKKGSATVGLPADLTDYTANSHFGSGSAIVSGEYVVYKGIGSTVNVTGLDFNTTYYAAVFEFNDTNQVDSRNYFATPGTGNASTLPLNEGLELTAVNTIFQVDFDSTVARVNNGAFTGVDIVPSPATGQLNSNAWAINEIISGGAPGVFGGSTNTGGGISTGNATTPTYYAFETSAGNRALGIQLSDTSFDFNHATVTLRLQNTTGTTITSLATAYTLFVLNNTNSEVTVEYWYSLDNQNYFNLWPVQDTSIMNADASPAWNAYLRSRLITGLSIPNGSNFYLRWVAYYNFSASPVNDEIALDDIRVVANPTTVFPRIAGNFENLTIDGRVQLGGNTTVTNNITLLGQNLELGNYNLTVGGNVQSTSSAFLQTNGTGTVTINNVTTARLFPIGVTTYNPVTISNGSGLNWTVSLSNGVNNVQSPFTTDKAVLRTWTISPSVNPSPAGANLLFGYNDGDATQIGSGFSNTEDVLVWHFDGSNWTTASGAVTPTGTPGNTRSVTLNNWSKYSSFAIADLSGPLPVLFGSIKATSTTAGIKISWTNLTESNVSYYSVERSVNGTPFTSIGQVNASLNNGDKAEYNWTDALPGRGVNFYRIRVVESGGKVIYSKTVKIDIERSNPEFSIYPNPVRGSQIYTALSNLPKGNYVLKIFTIAGQQVYKKSFFHEGGSVTMPVIIPSAIKPGYYPVQLEGEGLKLLSKIIVQ